MLLSLSRSNVHSSIVGDVGVRTWPFIVVGVESSRETSNESHLDEEDNSMEQRL